MKLYRQKQSGLDGRFPPALMTLVVVAIFLYLLYARVRLVIQSNVETFNAIVDFEDSPIARSKFREQPAERGLYNRNASDHNNLQLLAESLATAFSADDGIPSDERMGFDIPFTDPTDPDLCLCDVVSADCLHTIACIPDLHDPGRRNALAWLGIQFRRAIKATSIVDEHFNPYEWNKIPLGKMLQYQTIEVWKDWRTLNLLPKTYNLRKDSIFVNETWYPDCTTPIANSNFVVPKYRGVSCFYKGPSEPEDVSVSTTIENEANRWFNATVETRKITEHEVGNILGNFLRKHRGISEDKIYNREVDLFSTAHNDAHFSARGNLMLFAHIMRIMFNRRSFLDKIYQEKVTFVETPGSKKWVSQFNNDPFIVSVHMRRGDSCGVEDPRDYRKEASPLDSRAQTGGERQCYRTGVYLNAVGRIRSLVPPTRPVHVYLATDDVGDVIDEILDTNTIGDENAFGVEKWHFLNYSRSVFNYDSASIEDDDNRAAQPALGESAVSDLWHLSHGHALVGHLGSRFGKVSWLLATARRNNFVPFFSVDGHSFCCEIDEACGDMKPYITVENCLSFGHEYGSHNHEDYFKFGSLARKNVMLEHERVRKEGEDIEKKVDERKKNKARRDSVRRRNEAKRNEARNKWSAQRRVAEINKKLKF